MRKWWMGVVVLIAVFIAGLVKMLFGGGLSDTAFGLWIGAMTIDVFGYSASNLLAKKIAVPADLATIEKTEQQ